MNPHSINERFSFSQYIFVLNSSFSRRRFPTLFSVYKHTHTQLTIPLFALTKG